MATRLWGGSSLVLVLASAGILAGCGAVADKAAADIAEAASKTVAERAGPLLESGSEGIAAQAAKLRLEWILDEAEKSAFKVLNDVQPRARWKIITSWNVKDFVRQFEAGAQNPELHLNDPKIDPILLARWKAAPQDKRVFVAGSQEDLGVVQSLSARLQKEGRVVFFYKLCAAAGELCTSEAVGAFFKTAGTAYVAITSDAAKSPYLPNEVAAAIHLSGNGTHLLLFTPNEVMEGAANRTAVSFADAQIDGAPDNKRERNSQSPK